MEHGDKQEGSMMDWLKNPKLGLRAFGVSWVDFVSPSSFGLMRQDHSIGMAPFEILQYGNIKTANIFCLVSLLP